MARAGCLSAGVAAALAAGNGATRVLLCLVGALVLVVPLVCVPAQRFRAFWRTRGPRRVK